MVDTREQLLTAASRLLAEEGPEALTVRRIAAAAGVSTMGVYSRFGNKDGVVDALFREGFEGLHAAISAAPAVADPLTDLRGTCVAYRAFARSHATHYRIMFEGAVPGFEPSEESRSVAKTAFEALVERVDRCLEAGILGGATAEQIAASLWAATHGLVSLELFGTTPDVLAGDDPYGRTMSALVRGFTV